MVEPVQDVNTQAALPGHPVGMDMDMFSEEVSRVLSDPRRISHWSSLTFAWSCLRVAF